MLKKIFFFLLILFINNIYSVLFIDTTINKVVKHLLDQRYSSAIEYLTDILATDPDNINALYMRLNAIQAELLDYESYEIYGYKYIKAADSALAIIESKVDMDREDGNIQYLFYIGNIYGSKALILAKQGDWFKGLKYVRRSFNLLTKVRELDETIYAANLGIGLINYYIGDNLKWLPFMENRALKGISDIEKAVIYDTSSFRYAATNSLLWILVERGEFAKADSIVSSVLEEFPDNTIFLRIKARIELLTYNYENALKLAKKLVALSRNRKPPNWSDIMSGYQIVVAALDAMERDKKCLKVRVCN